MSINSLDSTPDL